MSTEEKDLIRIRAWDRYGASRQVYLAHKAKMNDWGNSFSKLAEKLSGSPPHAKTNDLDDLPTREEFQAASIALSDAVAELRQSSIEARHFGFPVDEALIREVDESDTGLVKNNYTQVALTRTRDVPGKLYIKFVSGCSKSELAELQGPPSKSIQIWELPT